MRNRPLTVFEAQTATLDWLRGLGHPVDYTRDYPGKKMEWSTYRSHLTPFNGRPCPYCHETMHVESPRRFPTRDRVIPPRAGGTYQRENVLVVCFACNNEKADRTLEEFARQLGRDPRAQIVWDLIEARAAIAKAEP